MFLLLRSVTCIHIFAFVNAFNRNLWKFTVSKTAAFKLIQLGIGVRCTRQTAWSVIGQTGTCFSLQVDGSNGCSVMNGKKHGRVNWTRHRS